MAKHDIDPLEFSKVHVYSPVSCMMVLYRINVVVSSELTNSRRLSSWLRWLGRDQVGVGNGLPVKEQAKMAVSSANTVRPLTISVNTGGSARKQYNYMNLCSDTKTTL